MCAAAYISRGWSGPPVRTARSGGRKLRSPRDPTRSGVRSKVVRVTRELQVLPVPPFLCSGRQACIEPAFTIPAISLYLYMNWREHIVSDQKILLGKPTVKGTRISVELILDLLSTGWTEKMILESYPTLTENDLKAVFSYLKEG